MMSQENNDQLEGQQNKPLNEREGLQESNKTGEQITGGANQEDQLDKIKQNAPEGGRDAYPERQAGTPPSTGDHDENEFRSAEDAD
jgi:hypothetical protein